MFTELTDPIIRERLTVHASRNRVDTGNSLSERRISVVDHDSILVLTHYVTRGEKQAHVCALHETPESVTLLGHTTGKPLSCSR